MPDLTVGETVVLIAILTTHHPPPACRDRLMDKLHEYADTLPSPTTDTTAHPNEKET